MLTELAEGVTDGDKPSEGLTLTPGEREREYGDALGLIEYGVLRAEDCIDGRIDATPANSDP